VSEDVVSVPALLDFLLDLAARRLVLPGATVSLRDLRGRRVLANVRSEPAPHARSSTSDLDRSWRSRQYSSIRRASVTTGLPSGVAWSRLLACSLSLTSVLRSAAA